MVTKASWQPAVSAVAPVSGSAERNARAQAKAAQPAPGQGVALTSHSFTLSTGLFQLGFTWRRLELESGQIMEAAAGPVTQALASPQAQRDEYQRRQQLLGLLSASPSGPLGQTIQSAASGQAPRQPSEAQRAYAKAAGPMAGDRAYSS